MCHKFSNWTWRREEGKRDADESFDASLRQFPYTVGHKNVSTIGLKTLTITHYNFRPPLMLPLEVIPLDFGKVLV